MTTLIPQVREQLEVAARQRAGRAGQRRFGSALRWLPAVAAVTVAVVVGAGAVLLLHARTGGTPARRSVGAQPLLRELAVLRRPARPVELRPFVKRFVTAIDQGAFLPGVVDQRLIRLATITSWGERVYLVPVRPLTLAEIGRLPASQRAIAMRWRRRDGSADWLAYFTYTPRAQSGGGSCCATAADIASRGSGSWGGQGATTVATLVVPDGVRVVELEFPRQEDLGAPVYRRVEVLTALVHGNVAAFRIQDRAVDDPFSYMTWYGTDGRRLKQFGDVGKLKRVVPPPKSAPPSRLSVAAQRDPAIQNPVTVSPRSGGVHARFSVSFRSLLNRARYQYVLSGPWGPGCTKTDTAGRKDWINFGALGVRGQPITHSLSVGYMGRSAWCPGTYRISVWASVSEHGSWRNALAPFATATVTVRR